MSEALNWTRGIAPRLLTALAVVAVASAILLPVFGRGPATSLTTHRAPGSALTRKGPATRSQGRADVQLTSTQLSPDPDLHVVGNSLVDASGAHIRLLGVDATGTEDACIAGRGFSWGPFDSAEVQAIAAWHVNAVRVPLNEDCWLGINGAPPAYSGAAYQTAIMQWVSELNAAGLIAILDLHWSAPGSIRATHEWPMPDETHAVTFWSQVASAFRSDPLVIFDLFNEPSLGRFSPTAANWSCWLNGCTTTTRICQTTGASGCTNITYQVAGMQQLVNTVRAAGANQPLMLGGLSWAATFCGGGSVAAGTCAWLTYEPADPLHQLVASFHNYYQKTKCSSLACWNTTIAALAQKVPVVTGELGEKDCASTFVQSYMQWADAHGVSYLLWAWQPADTTTCGPQKLLSNWYGSPNNKNPVGDLLLNHLGQEDATRI